MLAVAPAAYIDNELCEKVVHLVSRDIVPLIDGENRRRLIHTIIALEPHVDAPIIDHLFDSLTYVPETKKEIEEFINTYGYQ